MMRKMTSLVVVCLLVLVVILSVGKGRFANAQKVGAIIGASYSHTLPASFPRELQPLLAGAEIYVMENPASNGLEVVYVSDDDHDTLYDSYENALKDASNFDLEETENAYFISAMMDGVAYSIMLSEDAMDLNPHYEGKTVVYIILTGLEDIGREQEMPVGEGKAWPFEDLHGVPELKGHIDKILQEDGVIWLEMIVVDTSVVYSYIDELVDAGFYLDGDPSVGSDYLQFLAFRDGSMLNFAYDPEEGSVYLEFLK